MISVSRGRAPDCARSHSAREKRGDRSLGIARAASKHPAALGPRRELVGLRHVHRVEVRREQNRLVNFPGRSQARKQIGAVGQDGLKLDVQPRLRAHGGKIFRHASLARVRMSRRQKSRIDAGQRDQFGEESFDVGHRVSQNGQAVDYRWRISLSRNEPNQRRISGVQTDTQPTPSRFCPPAAG